MKNIFVFYDNWCPTCSRFMKHVKKMDWLNCIQFIELRNNSNLNTFSGINFQLAHKQMATYHDRWRYGFNSLYIIFLRLPITWFLIPFFFILKISNLGQLLYKEFAIKRKVIPIHCNDNCNIG